MPVKLHEWLDYIKKERTHVVKWLVNKSRKPDFDVTKMSMSDMDLYKRLQVFFRRLEYLEMTPKIKAETQMDLYLGLFGQPQNKFPESDKEKARSLLEKWEGERWGADEVVEEGSGEEDQNTEEDEEQPPAKRRKSSPSGVRPSTTSALLPPTGHPIFGIHGIMHGIALRTGTRRVPVLDPRYKYKQRPAQVYGHNGLQVGDWFPLQLVALFRGAHGVSQGGIAGHRETGAYSIIVSGHYDDLDRDNGNTILYSGSNSHSNTNPNAPAPSSGGTRALEASRTTQKPIRVLRASSGKSRWAPSAGLRYDGLYRVVQKRYPKNLKGGMYEQFKLERIEGQKEIDRSRPNIDELRDHRKISEAY